MGTYNGEETERYSERQIKAELARMTSRGILDLALSNGAIELPLVKASYSRKHNDLRLMLKAEDIPGGPYPEGFIAQGERYAVADELGIDYVRPQTTPPGHNICIASATLPRGTSVPELPELEDRLPSTITLGPIGTVRPY